MIVRVRGVLLRFANYEDEIHVPADTLYEGLMQLGNRYTALRDVLLDRDGHVRPTHLIALNGEQVSRADLVCTVSDDDRVDIVTAVSGG